MDDLHRAPGDSDRAALRERIKRAVAQGWISSVDGDIRLTNVSSAQSLTELSLIARDLDQLEAARASTERSAATVTGPPIPQVASSAPMAGQSSGRLVPLVILGVVVSLVIAGAAALVVFSAGSVSREIGDQPPVALEGGSPPDQTPSQPGVPGGTDPDPAVESFDLSAAGVTAFVRAYRQKFATTRVTDLTFYPDYVIVRVPVPGKKRDSGWIYRAGEWSDFGGVRAVFPGTATVDVARLKVPALMRNIARARRVLQVEDGSVSHVVINYRPAFDEVPNVNIYVSNEFSESGYLATDLDGNVERSYPYAN